MSQVAKRLKQEQDDKDLMIVFEDLPLVKVIFNSKGCCWDPLQEVEDLFMAAGQASLSGKNYLEGGRLELSVDWWVIGVHWLNDL